MMKRLSLRTSTILVIGFCCILSLHLGCASKMGIKFRPSTSTSKSCTNDHSCVGQALCMNGKCVAAKPMGRWVCQKRSDCPENGICKFGICFRIDNSNPDSDELHPDQPESSVGNRCTKHDDCGDMLVCQNGKCVQAEPTDKECQTHGDCSAAQACWHEVCFGSTSESKDGNCQTHDHCPGMAICVKNKCKEAELEMKCKKDADCTDKQICKLGQCIKLKAIKECTVHNDCSGNKLCTPQGKCIAGRRANGKCKENKDCGEGACKLNFCWTIDEEKPEVVTPKPADQPENVEDTDNPEHTEDEQGAPDDEHPADGEQSENGLHVEDEQVHESSGA